ncbi:MAG: Hsp20/alpha crystallin family protein [Myxococcota bacterium]
MWNRRFDFPIMFSELDRVRNQMDHLFRELESNVSSPGVRPASGPRVNLYDNGEGYTLKASLPGFDEEELKLTINQQTLTLSGTRNSEVPEGYSVHRRERGAAKFSRSFTFPERLDPENAHADFTHGLLTVFVPKSPELRPRQIAITTS